MPIQRSVRWLRLVRMGCLLAGAAAVALGCPARTPAVELADELKDVPFRIVFESFQDDNWELMMVNADGSRPVNLTKTPTVNEMYPHVSPDGSQVCFVVDGDDGRGKTRSVNVMKLDGTRRALIARNAREPCWDPTGTAIVFAKGESERFTLTDFATRGIYRFVLATRRQIEHPNPDIEHLYNICCTPDGKWYVATVHAGMGYSHAILAIETEGKRVFDLHIPGCRPDVSADGKRIAWGADDFTLRVGELDFSGPEPKVVRARDVVKSEKPMEVYHVDWSPDGKYLAFSRGPSFKRLGPAPEMIGVVAEGWNICVADASATNRWVAITADGKANKEPDWTPILRRR